MARRTEKLSLDGSTYEITQLPATQGLEVYAKLLKVLGPMLRAALSDSEIAAEAKQGETAGAGAKLATIIIRGFESLEPAFTLELAQLFARHTKVQMTAGMIELSSGDIFDQHFAGRFAHMTRWMLAHLKLNYADFLAGWAGSAGPSQAE